MAESRSKGNRSIFSRYPGPRRLAEDASFPFN